MPSRNNLTSCGHDCKSDVDWNNDSYIAACYVYIMMISMAGDTSQWWFHNCLVDSKDSGVPSDCNHSGLVHVANQSP